MKYRVLVVVAALAAVPLLAARISPRAARAGTAVPTQTLGDGGTFGAGVGGITGAGGTGTGGITGSGGDTGPGTGGDTGSGGATGGGGTYGMSGVERPSLDGTGVMPTS